MAEKLDVKKICYSSYSELPGTVQVKVTLVFLNRLDVVDAYLAFPRRII